jgi:hypothetical protein
MGFRKDYNGKILWRGVDMLWNLRYG